MSTDHIGEIILRSDSLPKKQVTTYATEPHEAVVLVSGNLSNGFDFVLFGSEMEAKEWIVKTGWTGEIFPVEKPVIRYHMEPYNPDLGETDD